MSTDIAVSFLPVPSAEKLTTDLWIGVFFALMWPT
jgi:hypothetical protein